jgi:hypothetical protein
MTQAPAQNEQDHQNSQAFQDNQGFQEAAPQASQPVTATPDPEEAKEAKSTLYATIAWAVILIGFGGFMLMAPDLMDGATAEGRRAFLKSIVIMVWGIPGGIASIALGGFLGYRAYTQIRGNTPSAAPALAVASKPAAKLSFSLKGDSSKAFADKVAPSKRELEAIAAKRRAQKAKK